MSISCWGGSAQGRGLPPNHWFMGPLVGVALLGVPVQAGSWDGHAGRAGYASMEVKRRAKR